MNAACVQSGGSTLENAEYEQKFPWGTVKIMPRSDVMVKASSAHVRNCREIPGREASIERLQWTPVSTLT
jgi:hypothetical protein